MDRYDRDIKEQNEEAIATIIVSLLILVVILVGTFTYDWYSYHQNKPLTKKVTEQYYEQQEGKKVTTDSKVYRY